MIKYSSVLNLLEIAIMLFLLMFSVFFIYSIGLFEYMLYCIIFFSSISISILFHEIAHFLAAKIFGHNPLYIVTGSNFFPLNKLNSFFSPKLFGIIFSINPLSTAGLTESDSYMSKLNRLDTIFICAAGPLVNLFIVLLMIYFFEIDLHYILNLFEDYNTFTIVIFTLINFGTFALNLFVFVKGSDGWYIFQELRSKNTKSLCKDTGYTKTQVQSLVNNKIYEKNLKQIIEN